MIKGMFLAFITIIIFFSAIILILSFTLYQFLYPSVYVESLEESGAFEYVEEQLGNQTAFIKTPEEGIEPVVEDLLGNTLSYVRSDTDELNLTVELDKEELRNFFLESMESVPVCQQNQTYSFDDLENLCRPPGIDEEAFLDELLESQNLSFFQNDTIDLAEVYGLEEGSEGKATLDRIRKIVSFYKIFVVFLLLIIGLLGVAIFKLEHKVKKFMYWFGPPLFLAGLTIVIAVLVSKAFLISYLPEIGVPLLPELIQSVANIIALRTIIFSSVMGALGACFMIAPFFIHQK